MNIITFLKLLLDSGAVSPKAPTKPSWLNKKDRSSSKGQGERRDLGLIRFFK